MSGLEKGKMRRGWGKVKVGDPLNRLVKKWVTGAAGIGEQQCGGDKTGDDMRWDKENECVSNNTCQYSVRVYTTMLSYEF